MTSRYHFYYVVFVCLQLYYDPAFLRQKHMAEMSFYIYVNLDLFLSSHFVFALSILFPISNSGFCKTSSTKQKERFST